MIRIGVLSDTHLKRPDPLLSRILLTHFADVSMVLHAGDMVSERVLEPFFEAGKEVIAVCGNMDDADVRACWPEKRILTVEGAVIGLIHGWGSPKGIRERLRTVFDNVDAIVYGHTHVAFSGREGGVYFFNPGSPTDSRFTNWNSVGIITVDGKKIQGTVISL